VVASSRPPGLEIGAQPIELQPERQAWHQAARTTVLEAAPGVEPGVEVLRTSALPLGHAAQPACRPSGWWPRADTLENSTGTPTDALPPLRRRCPCGPRLWRRARKVRTALLLKRSDELAALALRETADTLVGAHVAALQEPCSLDGATSRQGPEQCHHLGRAKVLRGVADEGGK
jgi:hypothetical protein